MIRRIFRLLPLDLRSKKYLKFFYFRTMAALGIEESPALNRLDRQMLAYLPQQGGVFVEAGANDGVSQSNTWFFERYRGWTGLLVEPVPGLAKMARRFRTAPVANVALGAADGGSLTLRLEDLMTKVDTDPGTAPQVTVPVRALSSLLDEHGISAVDFLSLDVEGYERTVLDGLNFNRHTPRYILVETNDFAAVQVRLACRYDFVRALSHHDYLFERKGSEA